MSWLIVIPLSILIIIILGVGYIYVQCRKYDDDFPSWRDIWMEERSKHKAHKESDRRVHKKWNSFLF